MKPEMMLLLLAAFVLFGGQKKSPDAIVKELLTTATKEAIRVFIESHTKELQAQLDALKKEHADLRSGFRP